MKIKSYRFELSCTLWLACGVVAVAQDAASKAPVSAPGTVTPIALPAMTTAQASQRKGSYSVTVPGSGDWTDAGFVVAAGDTMSYSATGQLTLWDARASAPAGVARGWKDLLRQFPLDSASAGALIGRIGSADAAVPFAIGGQLEQTVPASGELFLAANVPKEVGAQGSYKVSLKITAAKPVSQTTVSQATALFTPALLDGVPQRVGDEQGNPGDMVNFCIVGTKDAVEKAFTAAGWVQVDQTNNAAVLHGLLSTLSKKAYTAVPMSTLYLFGRPQDMSYARGDAITVAFVRHHLRVWDTGRTAGGLPVWVGSSTHDEGLEKDQRNNGITHHIDPEVDKERDFIQSSFAAAGVLDAAAYITPKDPLHEAKTATGGTFQSDGNVVAMVLRH
ncbi:LssY C-terminal domain-containing protein [Tunturibacter empetritectus]|uniref:LssY-like C-terminal domain-containing protein n=1 Tax=Tunturiibacter empetritectus TaxID=3069691 RepID=A0A7W8IGI1_9BACT|nr:LssY C-terminal domain-containing protein [Edaphobacter lichenicola]MBB5316715.1 hypothetical protein [Edaphobacter lichenicola]